jgi:CheY-like chemotaxis protein
MQLDNNLLTTATSPVNQKIAIKTIQKLGFQVTAAWNGKEALDYLIATSLGQNLKPDMILMDVQMPIIDGYKCTHLLRHHSPYKAIVQDVPIVAMTASAIQGDREKCKKAGMDDYLAKPVNMTILERMLLRWCFSRRKVSTKSEELSDCSQVSEHCDNAEIPVVGLEDETTVSKQNGLDDIGGDTVTPRPMTIANGQSEPSPFDSPAAVELGLQLRHQEGEKELSSMLQENKLIDAAGGPSFFRTQSCQDLCSGEALTEENVKKLKSETTALDN